MVSASNTLRFDFMIGEVKGFRLCRKREQVQSHNGSIHAGRILHNGRVHVRPLKHFASRRLRQTIRSAQAGHQLWLGTAREHEPASTRSTAVFSPLLSASLLRASPLVMVNQLPAGGRYVPSLTSQAIKQRLAAKKAASCGSGCACH
jgi:hypothetical protein